MASVSLVESLGIREEVIKKVCSISMKTHKYAGKQLYVSEKIRNSHELVFSFPGSWSASDLLIRSPFGEVEVDLALFPCLQYIGLKQTATVNEAFLNRFKAVLANAHFKKEVGAAVADGKQVVFTGHSLGGPIAVLATIWFLEEYVRREPKKMAPLCVTFGSPLVGDRIMGHALRRENWSRYFINFVMRYDIVPRMSLTPLSSVEQQLQRALNFFNPKSTWQENAVEAPGFFVTVMSNALSVVSHAASKMMGSTNLLLETLSNFVELSPYRPLGTYVFCTGDGKLVVIRNPDAVLQLLFYTSQLNSEEDLPAVAHRSLKDHLSYKDELQECLQMQSVTFLDDHHLEALPLSDDVIGESNMALNDLGLSARARLCLRAAGELEKQKRNNQKTMDEKMENIDKGLGKLRDYKNKCQLKVGYYDAFKISENKEDFDANVKRLELAGIWDEIIEMLKRNELPDEFESRKEWVEMGTRYRRIVEPLDVANYYRHLKNEDTGPYMERGRPKRYKCTQRWREHAENMSTESLESCFWAEVEDLCFKSGNPSVRDRVLQLKRRVEEWIKNGVLDDDVFLMGSTFDKLLKEHSLTNSYHT